MQIIKNRRDFLASASLAAAAGLLGPRGSLADEGPPETTMIRVTKMPGICIAPQYVAKELLAAEGFTEVHYVELPAAVQHLAMASGDIDLSLHFAAPLVTTIDAGQPITVLAGVHPGCFELFAGEHVRRIIDLQGKRVGVEALGSSPHVFLSAILSYVGLDPVKDIHWVTTPSVKPIDLFAEGKIDAFLGFPPDPQALRDRNIGYVILNSAVDRPWSQYFCCMVAANTEFIRTNPIATKRALRAMLKATDLCFTEPPQIAQRLVEGGFTERYDYALQALTEVPYNRWREFSAEDTLRFYALRLHEVGMIQSSPNALLAEGTDWRFLNELKRELKA
jgi:NitT/TauT family transport system substrate-binding protein